MHASYPRAGNEKIEVGEHDACRSDRLEWILWQSSQLIEIRVMPVAVH